MIIYNKLDSNAAHIFDTFVVKHMTNLTFEVSRTFPSAVHDKTVQQFFFLLVAKSQRNLF